jgi:SPP1 gp7 family putative phage head morphogenesis protein
MGARHERVDFVRLVEQAQDMAELEQALAEAVQAVATPADVASILDFLEIPASGAFDVPPEQAIGYFKAKGLKATFSYADMLDYQHDQAFTVAKMMDIDMLGQVRASLDAAMANGTAFKEWTKEITPVLQSGGWWGSKQVIDPLTGQEIVAQLGSPWRLETIFRTNMQTAYAAGAWQEIVDQKDLAPLLMYDAVDDFRTRPLHASWDRKVVAVDSVWWQTHYPPNGYNCRCGVIQLSHDEARAMGLKESVDPPEDGTYTWNNPRTGEKMEIPRGLDPGFAHNSGKLLQMKSQLAKLAQEKAQALAPDMAAAAKKALADAETKKVLDGLTSDAARAQQKAAAAAGKAALERAKALAEEKAAQWAAQQQIDAIAKGKETAGAGAAYKVKALAEAKKITGWDDLKPTEQLNQVLDTAAGLKVKADLSKGLSAYKNAILKGKNPPPSAVKAFKSLEPAEADAFISKVDAEKAAIENAAADAAAKAAAEAAAQAQAAAPVKPAFVDTPEPDPDTMVVIGRKPKGGTPGALYQDTATGQKWLVKFNGSVDAVNNEVLSSKLYNLAGVEAPDLHAITIDGKPALASRIVDGITEVPAKVLASTQSVTEGFAVDAWMANWDVAGLNFDNVVLVQGRALRIDVGGSLRYRAVGGLKGQAFGSKVNEIESLRDGTNAQARQVFGGMSAADVERSVEKVLAVADEDIRAVVLRYGPPDAADREALADLMIARKRDLELRFPAAAERVRVRLGTAEQAPSQAAKRVTAAEQEAVDASRVNGYGFSTDSDQVEDHQVIVHAFKRANGDDATRGFFKLLPGASNDLQQAIAATSQDTAPSVNVATARDAVLSAVKSINYRADKGQKFDETCIAKVKAALTQVDKLLADVGKMKTGAMKPETLAFVEAEFKAWREALAQSLPEIQKLGPAKKVTKLFPAGQLPDQVDFHASARAEKVAGPAWRRVTGEYAFTTSKFERSFATETGGRATVAGTSVRYETTLPDGTTVTYFPHDSGVAWAMQGVVKIDVPGRGVDSTTRVFGAMDEIGLKSVRATEVDRQHLYLNAFARIALLRKGSALKSFEAITDRTEAGVQAKLGMLKAATGLDVDATEGWRQIDGVRQAFGHGRSYQLRPDLDAAEMARLDTTHVLFHNPQGLGTNAGAGVFERLKVVIDGGGVFASLTDRVRRGVALSGSSVSSDLASGGGDYHFTRIRSRAHQAGSTGVYWKTSTLRRMDAITYEGDMFGRTTGASVETYRRGQDVDSFRTVAGTTSNETIFKGGMSIFDELDRIVLSSKAEVDEAIKWMQAKGYKAWPDGRPLAEVIITKDKHRAKP